MHVLPYFPPPPKFKTMGCIKSCHWLWVTTSILRLSKPAWPGPSVRIVFDVFFLFLHFLRSDSGISWWYQCNSLNVTHICNKQRATTRFRLNYSRRITLGKLSKKLYILLQPANFNSHQPTLPIYEINIYDKAVIIEAPTHLQVIMTNIKINFISSCFIFIIFNGKMDKQAL